MDDDIPFDFEGPGDHHHTPPQSRGSDDLPPEGVIVARLQAIDRWLKPRMQSSHWSRRDLVSVRAYHEFVDCVFDAYPAHDGDPIGGMAYRLVSELSWILEQNGNGR